MQNRQPVMATAIGDSAETSLAVVRRVFGGIVE